MRRMSRLVFGLAACAVLTCLGATPALAHAQFQSTTNGFPPNSQQTLRMYVPNERDDTNYNVGVAVYLPDSWGAISCAPKDTWTCATGTGDGRPTVTFTKATGAAPAEDEYFTFVVRTAATAGSYSFPTLQTYDSGEVVRWIGAKGSEEPAPVLVVLAASKTPQSITATTAHSGGAPSATTVASGAGAGSSTTVAGSGIVIPGSGTETTTTTGLAIDELPGGGGEGSGSTGLIVGAVIAVIVVAGAAVVLRSRRNPGAS